MLQGLNFLVLLLDEVLVIVLHLVDLLVVLVLDLLRIVLVLDILLI